MNAEVTFDKSHQLIRLRAEGALKGADAAKMSAAVTAAVKDLDDASRVRILVDGRQMGKIESDARRILMADFKRADLSRIAMCGVPIYIRLFLNAWYRAFSTDKVRFFDTEAAALEWLEERYEN
jgi:hypothetical protein